jgi:two-component system nitrogen regulation sensor histidine kinase NtrY
MPSPQGKLDSKELRKRKRERLAIVLILAIFLGLTFAEFKLTKVSNSLPFVNSIFFFGLLNINIILLIGLIWLIFRNIGKIFLERRSKLLGSGLKSKLVAAFLSFSIIPTLVLFTISSLYINSSFDKWFSIKIQNTLQASLEITRAYYRNGERIAVHFADHLSKQLGTRIKPSENLPLGEGTLTPPRWVQTYLDEQRQLLALNAVEYYSDSLGTRLISQTPREGDEEADRLEYYPRLSLDLLDRAFSGEQVSVIQHVGTGDLIRCLMPIRVSEKHVVGVVVVNAYIPVSLVNKVDEISNVFEDYKDTNPLKYPVKTTYFVILVMITLVIIFVAIWLGLFMAREMMVPVERLVQGAAEVGSGNLDFSIERSGQDEIAVLIESFNKMTRDLKENRQRLTQATEDLEKRRLQLEAVLANIGTGVLVVDSQGKITTFNRALSELLEMSAQQALRHGYADVLQGEAKPLVDVIHRALTSESNSKSPEVSQWNFKTEQSLKSLAAIATPLREGETTWGVVVVVDDMTLLVKGQREMAWREVARRIAHEIKNPLTPIKLSAQRLQRRMGHYKGEEGSLLQECTDTIIKHTDELKEMVNEFSNFARFPETSPAPHNLNQVVSEVHSLFSQAHPKVRFTVDLESKLPIFEFDRDQIKRVMMNLLDNAIGALQQTDSSQKTPAIKIETHFHEKLQMAVLSVEDNGVGMTEEVRSRVFEPYFSTKKEGTGLGLAIVKRIINDHDGFIRVRSSPGAGTQFLIELPTAIRADLVAVSEGEAKV